MAGVVVLEIICLHAVLPMLTSDRVMIRELHWRQGLSHNLRATLSDAVRKQFAFAAGVTVYEKKSLHSFVLRYSKMDVHYKIELLLGISITAP